MLVYTCNNCGNEISFLHIEYKTDNTPACLQCISNDYGDLHRSDTAKVEAPLAEIIENIWGNKNEFQFLQCRRRPYEKTGS